MGAQALALEEVTARNAALAEAAHSAATTEHVLSVRLQEVSSREAAAADDNVRVRASLDATTGE